MDWLQKKFNSKILTTPYWEGIVVFVIVLISFFNFSERYYPLLNSDMAIIVLMSMDFSFPDDLYFWGQNRLGSLISLLAYPLIKILQIHPIMAVAMTKYGVLIAGYFGFAYFFRLPIVRILLALIWFLPPFHQTGFVLYVFGIQLSLTALGLVAISRFIDALKQNQFRLAHCFIALSSLILMVGLWVSDPIFITLFVLILFGVLSATSFFQKYQRVDPKQFALIVLHFSIWVGVGLAFVFYAKNKATYIANYDAKLLNNMEDLWSAFSIFSASLLNMALFRTESLVESVYLYAVVFLIGTSFLFVKKINFRSFFKDHKWGVFFGVNFLCFFGMIFLSHWVLENNVARRYFTMAYAFAWISFFYLIDKTYNGTKPIISKVVLPVVLLGSLSGFIGYYFPKKTLSKINVLAGFNSLGKVGLIGEYWNSYVSALPNPYVIKASPTDTETVRNKALVKETLSQPKVYLIKDMWLDSFPSSIFQHDTLLNRVGDPFEIGGAVICQYEVEVCRKFSCLDSELRSSSKKTVMDKNAVSGRAFETDSNAFKSHFIFGPYIGLAPGNYELKVRLKIDDINDEKVVGFIDIAAKDNEVLGTRNINTSDFDSPDKYEDLSINFSITKAVVGTEFRILYYGGPKLSFDFLRLYKF